MRQKFNTYKNYYPLEYEKINGIKPIRVKSIAINLNITVQRNAIFQRRAKTDIVTENVSTSTIYSIINRYNNEVPFLDKPKTDKPSRLSESLKKKKASEKIDKKIWGFARLHYIYKK